MREVFGKNFAVQGADFFDIQARRFFKYVLNLNAVFADDSDIISPRLVRPRRFRVKIAEFAERVRGKENFLLRTISEHDFPP